MGEVWRARDTKLGREVAIKTLPEEFATDSDRLARFEREAKLLASLNHPNIAAIYGLEEHEGTRFLVLELVEGPTLGDRIKDGAIPLEDSLKLALQIAEALRAAHEKGVIHRDLKPDNIKVTPEGTVKVLDFGLAKAMEPSGASAPNVSQLPTISSLTMTEAGTIAGTPAYMSPEQVRGEPLDTRSDVFAFGVVLCEMVSGTHPFRRSHTVQTLSAILDEEPRVVDHLPASLRSLIEHLLAKHVEQRASSLEAVARELTRLASDPSRLEDTSAVGGRTPFVGRDTEQRELLRLLDDVQRNRGGVVLIGGEPGVGKTRLAEELLDEARGRRMLTVVGHCYEQDGAQPFIPFVESLESIARMLPDAALWETLADAAPEIAKLVPELKRRFPDMPPPIDLSPEQQRRHLFNNIQEFAQRLSRRAGIVWLLDDLHWADESSLLLLQHLISGLRELPILIVGTYRDVELEVGRPFERVLATLVRQRQAQRLALRRLPRDAVAKLLEALAGQPPPVSLVDVIYDETEGNPFFAEEVFAHLSEEGRLFDSSGAWKAELELSELDVPEGVRLVIGRRLERLSKETQTLLTSAAVIGRRFDLAVLQRLDTREGDAVLDALDEAEAARLIAAQPDTRNTRYDFTHELIRQTLMGTLSLPRRQRWHLKVADAIERAYGDRADDHAADLGYHLYQAGTAVEPDRVTRYLLRAGEQALEAAAADEALRHFEMALELEAEDERVGANLLLGRAKSHLALSKWNVALSDLRASEQVFEELEASDVLSGLAGMSVFLRIMCGHQVEAVAVADRELNRAEAQPSRDRCRLLTASGFSSSLTGNEAKATELLDSAHRMARELADPVLEGEVLAGKASHGIFYFRGRDAAENGAAAVRLLRPTRNQWALADAMNWHGCGAMYLGEIGTMTEIANELDRLARESGQVLAHRNVRWFWSCAAFTAGKIAEAERWLLEGVKVSAEGGMDWANSHNHSVLVAWTAMAGRWNETWMHVKQAHELDSVPGAFDGTVSGHQFFAEMLADRVGVELLSKVVFRRLIQAAA